MYRFINEEKVSNVEKKGYSLDKKKCKNFCLDILFLFMACCFGSFSTVAVMIPNGLTTGGLTGIVRLLQSLIGMDFSIIYYISSFTILTIVFFVLGFNEVRKILILTVMYPAVLFMFEKVNLDFLEHKDILLAAVFCGVFSGISAGIVINRGYVFSGTDAISKMIRKKIFPQISQSRIMVSLDAIIIVISAFVFGRNIALYALITQAVVSKTIDVVLFGFEGKIVQLEIVTKEQAGPITEFIIYELGRGVSSEKVVGEYSKEKFTKLRLLCSPRENILMKRKLAELDPSALVTVIQLENAWGRGFKSIHDDR